MFHPRPATRSPVVDLSTTVVGYPVDIPVLLAPVGGIRLVHRDGEAGIGRAAGRAGTIQIVSGLTFTPIEEIVATATGPIFFQLYLGCGREADEARIERAKKAGCAALVVTIDAPLLTPRERFVLERGEIEVDGSLASIMRLIPQFLGHLPWVYDFVRDGMPMTASMFLNDHGRALHIGQANAELSVTPPAWDDLQWVRRAWGGPLIVKGVLHPDDARRAVDEGADAVVVSNHGGNMLDGVRPTIHALPAVIDAVGSQAEVLLDGGIRRASDVVKALALGARAVLIGRAYAWPFAAAGEAGVTHMLERFRGNLKETMTLLGCGSIHDLSGSYASLSPTLMGMAPGR